MLDIKTCPTCGSHKIKKVRCVWTGDFQGQQYSVPDLEYYEYPRCGEKVYDREAMRRIEAHSPAFTRSSARN